MITSQISKYIVLLIMISLAHFVNGQETEFDHEVVYCETCLDVVPLDTDVSCCFRWEDMEGNILSYDTLRTCEINAGLYKLIKSNGKDILKEEIWNIRPKSGELSLTADKYTLCGDSDQIYLTAETDRTNYSSIIWFDNPYDYNTWGSKVVTVDTPGRYSVSLIEPDSGCELRAFVDIIMSEEVCSNGIDDDCDGKVDCEDEDCDIFMAVCSCEYIEIVPVIEECDCESTTFLEVVSYSEIEKVSWDTGEESFIINVGERRYFSATVHFVNGSANG